MDEFVRLDSKLAATLLPLVIRPGELTKEWSKGRRARYVSPLKLYLTITFVFFLVARLLHPASDFAKHMNVDVVGSSSAKTGANGGESRDKSGKAIVTHVPAKKGVTSPEGKEEPGARPIPIHQEVASDDEDLKDFDKMANEGVKQLKDASISAGSSRAVNGLLSVANGMKSVAKDNTGRTREQFIEGFMSQIPTAIFLMLPVFAAVLWLLYIRSKRYYVEHLVFALHCHAFYFLLLLAVTFLPAPKGSSFSGEGLVLVMIVAPIYSWIALWRNYREGPFKTTFKWILLGYLYLILLGLAMLGAVLVAAASVSTPA
jgi:hypothetical protein